jgi:putative ABC transport system permease protein
VNAWESVLVSLESLSANKLRSFLTIIGIVVGVAAVVTVISIGQAGKSSILSDIDKYGEGFFVVFPDSSQGSVQESVRPTLSDLDALKRVPGIKHVSGDATVPADSKTGRETYRINAAGTTADWINIESMELTAGRFFSAAEERSRQKVAVVESDYAEKIYGDSGNAIGRRIALGSVYYRIVGVYKSEKSLFSSPNKNQFSAYLPATALPDNNDGANLALNALYFKANSSDPDSMAKLVQEVKKTLSKRHNVPVSAYVSRTGAETQELVNSTFSVLQIIIGSIAGISLFVGGIGVMNIMLVSVTERTREIGIRKAIGATPGVIMGQFLVEALILCFIGGLAGVLLGLSGAYIFSIITKWPFIIGGWAILLAFGFSAAVGLFFGIYPASKAARLQPIEALRYE